MIGSLIARIQDKLEMHEMRTRELEYRFIAHQARSEMVFDYIQLHFEATEPSYQDRLNVIAEDDIKKYTLAEVESARFMTDSQFNDLRASKREEN